MVKFKQNIFLMGLTLAMAACSSQTATTTPTTPTTFTRSQTNQAAPTAAPLSARAVVVEKIVTVDGVLTLKTPTLALGFDASGIVNAINVTLGQAVKKGDVLASVDDTTLQDAVADAQAQLDSLRSSIAQQSQPATKEELAAAQAALNSAYTGYNTTKAGSTASELESARVSAETAKTQYMAAGAGLDLACGSGTATQNCKAQEVSYGNAYESMVAAEARYKALLIPVSKEKLTQAYNSVASTKARLEALKAGVTEAQQKINEAQLSQAQATLDHAKANLMSAKLFSPCDCVVQAVNVAVGMQAGNNAISLVDTTGLQFKTTNLTERDVANIKIGSLVIVRLKAHAGALTGKVNTVLGQSTGAQSGTALFTVLVDLDATDKRLLPGMTGQAEVAIQ